MHLSTNVEQSLTIYIGVVVLEILTRKGAIMKLVFSSLQEYEAIKESIASTISKMTFPLFIDIHPINSKTIIYAGDSGVQVERKNLLALIRTNSPELTSEDMAKMAGCSKTAINAFFAGGKALGREKLKTLVANLGMPEEIGQRILASHGAWVKSQRSTYKKAAR